MERGLKFFGGVAAACTDSRSTRRIGSRSARRFALGERWSECADSSAHA